MSLSNSQMEPIFRKYENTRLANHRTMENRLNYIRDNIEGYAELEQEIINESMNIARRGLSGDADAMNELHSHIAKLKAKKSDLLKKAGYPEDYLNPIYTCPDCKDTGYIDNRKCHCLKQQIIDVLYEQSNIREFIAVNNFDSLSDEYYKGEDLDLFNRSVKICHDFIDNFDTNPSNLLFYGNVGTGKSFLSGCVAKEFLEKGYSVIYFSAINLFKEIARITFENQSKEELYNLYDYIYNCDLLIIDDLGTELSNSFVSSELFSCINERALRKKSTIISTNLSLPEIRDRYSDRVFSRIISSFSACKLSGPDIRIIKKTN